MIVNKKPQVDEPSMAAPPILPHPEPDIPVELRGNAIIGAYRAVRNILEGIREDPNDPDSPQFFKTIKLDNGQLSRIKNNSHNKEYGLVLPAVFIHFIEVYYNVGAGRIAEGKGTMRIHYVLNRLNNSDDGEAGEEEGLVMLNRIIEAIEAHKKDFPQLVSRFQLQYWDQPLTFDDAVQPYWIDYQIWFTDYTTYMYKDYVDAYAVSPPFTNHSDQNETANPDNIPNETNPQFDEVASLSGVKS